MNVAANDNDTRKLPRLIIYLYIQIYIVFLPFCSVNLIVYVKEREP